MVFQTRPLLWWTAAGSVIAVLAKVLSAGTTIAFAGRSIAFGTIDGGLVAAVLTPTLTALVAHGHGSLKDSDGDGIPDEEEEPPSKI